MARETPLELLARMDSAQRLVPAGYIIRHVKTGVEYMVHGHALRVGGLELMVNYSPMLGRKIIFSRALVDIRTKFTRVDGRRWPALSIQEKEMLQLDTPQEPEKDGIRASAAARTAVIIAGSAVFLLWYLGASFWSWNAVAAGVFGAPEVTFLQSLGFHVLLLYPASIITWIRHVS